MSKDTDDQIKTLRARGVPEHDPRMQALKRIQQRDADHEHKARVERRRKEQERKEQEGAKA